MGACPVQFFQKNHFWNNPVLTDLPEKLNANDALTINTRKNTLARAATIMFTPDKPLAPPPTVLKSLKAIILTSCSYHFFITKQFSFKCAARAKCPPTMYTRLSVYSVDRFECVSDSLIKQWALHFALPSSNKKDTLVFICEFPCAILTSNQLANFFGCFRQFRSFLLYP